MEKQLNVAAGILTCRIAGELRYLLARRAPGQAHAGHWEFPGGKLEAGESPARALARELAEELSIDAQVGRLVHSYAERDGGRQIAVHFFLVPVERRVDSSTVHDELRWLSAAELLAFVSGTDGRWLLPADREPARMAAAGLLNDSGGR